jgi:hypothetical protein
VSDRNTALSSHQGFGKVRNGSSIEAVNFLVSVRYDLIQHEHRPEAIV